MCELTTALALGTAAYGAISTAAAGVTATGALAAASAGATLFGAGVSYLGAQQTAKAQSDQAKYNATVAQNNQVLANAQASDAIERGKITEAQKAIQTAQLIGKQRTALAANGVDVNSGSAVDLQGDAAAAGTLDELTIRNNALRESVGFQNQGLNYGNQAKLDQAASQDALNGGALKGAATLIGGAGQVASQWYNFNYGQRQTSAGRL